MIDLIEITIQSGIERTEVLLFPNKKIAYINDKKIGITEQDINNILDIIFPWKKEYGTRSGIDLEEWQIKIISNNEETKYHGKGIYPNTYQELKRLVGELNGREN